MDKILIIKIILGTMCLLGSMILFFLAYKLGYKYIIQEKACTAKTKGTVKGYTRANRGSGIHLPIVYYTVNGKEYKIVGPEYKLYKTITSSSPLKTGAEIEYEENEKQILTVRQHVNSFFSFYKNPMKIMYPEGTEIDVFYNLKKPKLAYVLRYCNKKFMFWILLGAGMVCLLCDLIIAIV